MQVLDPVCTMMVGTEETTIKSNYNGQTYYFCKPDCKSLFAKSPERYAKLSARMQGSFEKALQGTSDDEPHSTKAHL